MQLLQDLLVSELRPDVISFNSVISACEKGH